MAVAVRDLAEAPPICREKTRGSLEFRRIRAVTRLARAWLVSSLMQLTRGLHRHVWLVNVALLSVTALLHAEAITAIFASRMTPTAPAPASAAERHPVAEARRSRGDDRDVHTILARNAFDSVTGPLVDVQQEGAAPAEAALVRADTNPMHAPPCAGVKVIAIAASTDPDWSLASFALGPSASHDSRDARPVLRRRGGDVSGKTIEAIGLDRVWLTSNEGRCQSVMFQPAPPPVPSATKPVDKASPGDALTNELKARIRKTGPKEYKVQREVVEKLLENPTLLMAHGQLVPAVETGGASALKLVGIKPDSLLGAIGLESGDRLLSINGVDITSPEKALSAYGRLSGAPHLTIAVARASGPTSLDYDIE